MLSCVHACCLIDARGDPSEEAADLWLGCSRRHVTGPTTACTDLPMEGDRQQLSVEEELAWLLRAAAAEAAAASNGVGEGAGAGPKGL